jgi:hypothetical protein
MWRNNKIIYLYFNCKAQVSRSVSSLLYDGRNCRPKHIIVNVMNKWIYRHSYCFINRKSKVRSNITASPLPPNTMPLTFKLSVNPSLGFGICNYIFTCVLHVPINFQPHTMTQRTFSYWQDLTPYKEPLLLTRTFVCTSGATTQTASPAVHSTLTKGADRFRQSLLLFLLPTIPKTIHTCSVLHRTCVPVGRKYVLFLCAALHFQTLTL